MCTQRGGVPVESVAPSVIADILELIVKYAVARKVLTISADGIC
jgi:hypothetical protein